MSPTLKIVLEHILTAEEKRLIFRSFDVIGDIVVIRIPEPILYKKYEIGKKVLENIKSAKSVFLQTSPVKGKYRIRKLELLNGIDNTITEYHEHGCRFKVDIRKVYFSPRLSTERLRIANKVENNETVTNMFAGVGTFSIIIARMNKNCEVYSIDSNSVANTFCLINTKLNKVQHRVMPLCGDAKYIITKILACKSNRVLMPLPEKSKEFVDPAVSALKKEGGVIHYFAHVKAHNKENAVQQGILDTKDAFKRYNYKIDTTNIVREVGPRIYQIVSDVFVYKI